MTFCLRNRKQRPFIKAYNNATVKVHGVTPSFSISWYTFKMYCITSHTKCRFRKESTQVTHTFFSNSAFFRTNILNQELRLNSKVTAMHEHGLQGNILSHLWDNTGSIQNIFFKRLIEETAVYWNCFGMFPKSLVLRSKIHSFRVPFKIILLHWSSVKWSN